MIQRKSITSLAKSMMLDLEKKNYEMKSNLNFKIQQLIDDNIIFKLQDSRYVKEITDNLIESLIRVLK
jgi:hypothetical protein